MESKPGGKDLRVVMIQQIYGPGPLPRYQVRHADLLAFPVAGASSFDAGHPTPMTRFSDPICSKYAGHINTIYELLLPPTRDST